MRVSLGPYHGEFSPWRPELGVVFTSIFALDTETTLIDKERDWLTPGYVLGAVFDGQRGFFLLREQVAEFLQQHAHVPMIMHHAQFDLAVLHAIAPAIDIYQRVDQKLVWDTRLLHRLLTLGTAGHTARGEGQSTLESCVSTYLNIELSKSVIDSAGDDVRRSYAKWLNQPPCEIEPVYLEYLGKDVIATFHLFGELMRRLTGMMSSCTSVWGYVSPAWLNGQLEQWGPQTHHIQLKAAIVLQAIKANGLAIDHERRGELHVQLSELLAEYRQHLGLLGYLPGQAGSGKALQEIMKQLERKHPDMAFPKTPTGKYVTKQEALQDLAAVEPVIDQLLKFKEIEKLQSTFIEKLGKSVVHPSFDPLMVTGRTSSFGEINAQNLPRDDRVRSCFIASPGHVFIDADYAALEMATLAQAVQTQFGWPSAMAQAINEGQDLHQLVAARVTGKAQVDVSREERQRAKPINFGKPGGMGDAGLQRYAKSSYGVDLSAAEVEALSNSWLDLFPEMRSFLERSDNLGFNIADFFTLTPRSVFDASGISSFLKHPDNENKEDQPHPILGWMFRKTLCEPDPKTKVGTPYDPAMIDFFWTRAESSLAQLSAFAQDAVCRRQPSPRLAWEIVRLVDQQACFTLTGRLRANASYCACHNTLFQGLAADGAKLALWRLWRAGYRIVNFIHDEVLVEVPEDSDLDHHAKRIRQIMIDAMREVVPDVLIDVEYAATRCWSKDAKRIEDDDGKLLVWEPASRSAQRNGGPVLCGSAAAAV